MSGSSTVTNPAQVGDRVEKEADYFALLILWGREGRGGGIIYWANCLNFFFCMCDFGLDFVFLLGLLQIRN